MTHATGGRADPTGTAPDGPTPGRHHPVPAARSGSERSAPGPTSLDPAPGAQPRGASVEVQRMLAGIQRMLYEDRLPEALAVCGQLVNADDPQTRVDARVYQLAALINLDRSDHYATAVDSAFDAIRNYPEPGRYGRLHALAAIAAFRFGSLERCVTHMVRSALALTAVELTDSMTAWGWHNLAMAYSYTGFHSRAAGAIEHARQISAEIGLPATDFAAPGIRLRLAVSLDHRGDTDGCQRVLRDITNDAITKQANGELGQTRAINRANYAYAAARLAALGYPRILERLDPRPLLLEGTSRRAADLRVLSKVCLAIAGGRPIEAVARLETVTVSDETLGPAEVARLRALAHVVSGDHASAYAADRQAFRLASTGVDQLRNLLVEGIHARVDREDLHRRVARYADEANTDPLTGLPNRRYLEQYVNELVDRGGAAVLGVCDLDGFKSVNTVHGHLSGDLVLQRVAGVLSRIMRRGDFVARYGGDEFVVVLPTTPRPEAYEIARRIVQAVSAEDWNTLVPATPISVTIGWAPVGEDGYTTVTEAFEAADLAMLRAKTTPRAS